MSFSSATAQITIGTTTLDAIVPADAFHADGTAGNTEITGDAGTFFSSTGHSADNLWGRKDGRLAAYGFDSAFLTPLGIGENDFLEAWGTEDNPALTTTVTDLPPATYDVYAVFMTSFNGSSPAGLQAALSGAPLVSYLHADVDDSIEGTVNWAISVVKVGTTAPNSTSFSVDIDNHPDGANVRDGYIGVGYAVSAAPEFTNIVFEESTGGPPNNTVALTFNSTSGRVYSIHATDDLEESPDQRIEIDDSITGEPGTNQTTYIVDFEVHSIPLDSPRLFFFVSETSSE